MALLAHRKGLLDELGVLWRLVTRSTRGRTAISLQISIVSMIAVLLGEIWQLPILSLIPITVGALWQANRLANMKIAVTFLVFFTLVIGALYIGAVLTVNNFFATLAVNLLFSFVFFYLGTASSLGLIAVVAGLVLSYLLLTLDTIHDGDTVMRFILYAWLVFLLIGGLLAVVGSVLAPSPRRVLMKQIAERLSLTAQFLAPELRNGKRQRGLTEAVMDTVKEGVSGMMVSLALMGQEGRWAEEDINKLRRAALHSFAVLQLAEQRFCRGQTDGPWPERKIMAELIEEMTACFDLDRLPCEIGTIHGLTDPTLLKMLALLENFTEPLAASELAPPVKEGEEVPKPKKPGFFKPDAFTNAEHIRQAIKGTVSVFFAIVTYKMLNWPGVHTCMITCFIVSMPTMGAVMDKQILRIGGSLLGCSLSMFIITFLMPHMTNVAQLLLSVGAVVFCGAWVKAGDVRISYIGLQIMVGFLLCDLTQPAPVTDLTVPRDRVIGILIGLSISFAVHTLFWPRSAAAGLPEKLKQVDGLLKREVDAVGVERSILQVAQVQEAVAGALQSLRYAMIEPSYIRPPRRILLHYHLWLRQARRRAGLKLLAGDAGGIEGLIGLERILNVPAHEAASRGGENK